MNICSIADCDKIIPPKRGGILCEMHYYRQRRHGDVNTVKKTGPKPLPERPSDTSEYIQRTNLKVKCKNVGITVEDYDRMHLEQQGLCAICQKPCSAGRRLAIDHCHRTGRVRKLLCMNCNIGIGNLQDDPELLEAAAKYLRSFVTEAV